MLISTGLLRKHKLQGEIKKQRKQWTQLTHPDKKRSRKQLKR